MNSNFKNKMKRSLLALVMAACSVGVGVAKAELRVGAVLTGSNAEFEVSRIQRCRPQQDVAQLSEEEFEELYLSETMSCENKQMLESLLSVSRVTLSIASAGAICGGIPTAVALTMAGFDIGIGMVDLVVKNIQCHDARASERNRGLIRQTVCEVMSAQGYPCQY